MQQYLSGASDAPLPYRYREAAKSLVESAASIACAEGDDRPLVIEEEAAFVLGLVSRDLLEKKEAIDRLQRAIAESGADRDYGVDAIQAILARAHVEARREHRRENLSELKGSVSICAADVEIKPLRWLWNGRMALGKIALLAGNPGLGKSQITIGIAATTTTGSKYPDGSQAPCGSVVFISCEDDYADTVVPRLVAAGADCSKVYFLHWICDDGEKHFDVGAHCGPLEELCDAVGDVLLIVIDPISAYCGSADTHKAGDVRQALAPLQLLAAKKDAAVIMVGHLNKSSNGDPLSRVSGSGAYVAVARSAFLVAPDPADDSGRRRYLATMKASVSGDETGFAFRVESVALPDGIETSRVVFESGTVEIAAGELLQAQGQSPEERSQLEEATDLLSAALREGPIMRKTIKKMAREADVSDITLKRAKAKLRIKHKKMKGTGEFVWCLPQHMDQLDQLDHEIGDVENDPHAACGS